jgi:hypothetical protein
LVIANAALADAGFLGLAFAVVAAFDGFLTGTKFGSVDAEDTHFAIGASGIMAGFTGRSAVDQGGARTAFTHALAIDLALTVVFATGCAAGPNGIVAVEACIAGFAVWGATFCAVSCPCDDLVAGTTFAHALFGGDAVTIAFAGHGLGFASTDAIICIQATIAFVGTCVAGSTTIPTLDFVVTGSTFTNTLLFGGTVTVVFATPILTGPVDCFAVFFHLATVSHRAGRVAVRTGWDVFVW